MNKYDLVIKPRAIQMAKDAFDWYEEQQEGLGELFMVELENGYDKLETWPLSFAKSKTNYRQFVMRRFPYVIIYETVNNAVVVYAVFHTSRHPGKKFRK